MKKFAYRPGSPANVKLHGHEEELYLNNLRGGMVWLDNIYQTAKDEAVKLIK